VSRGGSSGWCRQGRRRRNGAGKAARPAAGDIEGLPPGNTAGVGHVPLRGSGSVRSSAISGFLAVGFTLSLAGDQATRTSCNLSDPLSLAVRLKRLIPRPVDVRRAAVQLAKALAAALYVARRCRDSPRWKIRVWEAEAMILDVASALAWTWPTAHKMLRKELKKLGGEAPV
jgi:hypothetical protein